jgi:CheY-like chemotaxis protein
MRVLVVDDEALIVMLVAGWLQDLGCEVDTALNGTDALTKLNGKPHVEVLLTDVNMPGMSGHELAERAMHMRPGLKVVLLSGAATDAHGLPLIRKPLLRDDLSGLFKATLRRKNEKTGNDGSALRGMVLPPHARSNHSEKKKFRSSSFHARARCRPRPKKLKGVDRRPDWP